MASEQVRTQGTNGHSHERDQAQRAGPDQKPPEHTRGVPSSAKEDAAWVPGLGSPALAEDHTRADMATVKWDGTTGRLETSETPPVDPRNESLEFDRSDFCDEFREKRIN